MKIQKAQNLKINLNENNVVITQYHKWGFIPENGNGGFIRTRMKMSFRTGSLLSYFRILDTKR